MASSNLRKRLRVTISWTPVSLKVPPRKHARSEMAENLKFVPPCAGPMDEHHADLFSIEFLDDDVQAYSFTFG